MLEFQKNRLVFKRINEAVVQGEGLGLNQKADIVAELEKARATLDTTVPGKNQVPLLLAAARRHILEAERLTVALIIGDGHVTSQQMSHLVRVRILCAELSVLLRDALDEQKAARRSAWQVVGG